MFKKLSAILLTFWLGSLWFNGVVASVIFNTLDDRQLAGVLAGKLFTMVSYIGMSSALYLIAHAWITHGKSAFKQSIIWIIVVMLLFILVGHFGIQSVLAHLKILALPNQVMDSEYASQFGLWHGVAGVFYTIECLLGIVLLLKMRANTMT